MSKRYFIVSVFGDGDKGTCHLDKMLLVREVRAHASNFLCCPKYLLPSVGFCVFVCSPSAGQDKKTNTQTTVQHAYECNTIYCVLLFQLKLSFKA